MAKTKFKEGDEITLSGTVTAVDGDQVTIEINDGNDENHHCITLGADQLAGESESGKPGEVVEE